MSKAYPAAHRLVTYATRAQLKELYRLTGRDQYPVLTQGEAGRLIRQARINKKERSLSART